MGAWLAARSHDGGRRGASVRCLVASWLPVQAVRLELVVGVQGVPARAVVAAVVARVAYAMARWLRRGVAGGAFSCLPV